MPIALIVNLVNAALVAITLRSAVAHWLPALWFGAVGIVTVGRGILWWRYRRAAPAADPRAWSRGATLGSFCAGLSWGIGGAMLFPLVAPLSQLFLTIAIGGMCVGAVVLSASHLPTLLAFLLPACLPMASRVITEGTPTNTALGAMILVFAVAMTFAATHLNRIFGDAMRLRFELDEANRQLRSEIAEHRATEAALRQAQKLEAIGHVTGGIAHDFNNLLTVVIGNLVMAKSHVGGNAVAAQLIENAVQAAERGVFLIQRLLGFARKQPLNPQPVDLGQLLAGTEQMLSSTLGPQIRLNLDIPPNIATAEIDPNQLELAMLNLAINARDAMPAGGTLRIAITNRRADDTTGPPKLAGGDYVVVEIADTGIGMDEATLAQAFDPFFTTKALGVGTGLGLPTVQGFVVQSGGAVRLSSQLGAGTTVELWLPAATLPAPTLSQAPSNAAKIVICDDDAGVRRYVADCLGAMGYSVQETAEAQEALRLVEDLKVDLLIVEYALSRMSGTEVVRLARQQRPWLRVLLITNHVAAVGEGADIAILQKPFRSAELSRKVGEILRATNPSNFRS
jgi:signal transduction histidine kinase